MDPFLISSWILIKIVFNPNSIGNGNGQQARTHLPLRHATQNLVRSARVRGLSHDQFRKLPILGGENRNMVYSPTPLASISPQYY